MSLSIEIHLHLPSVSFNRNSFTLTRKEHTMKEKGKYLSHGIHVDYTDSEIFIIHIKGERKQSDDMKTVFFVYFQRLDMKCLKLLSVRHYV